TVQDYFPGFNSTGVLLVTGDNRAGWFNQGTTSQGTSDTAYTPEDPHTSPTFGTLSKKGDGTYELRNVDGTKEIFDNQGYLVKRIDRRGQVARQYYYSIGVLTDIADYPEILTGQHTRVTHFNGGLSVTENYGTDGAHTAYIG